MTKHDVPWYDWACEQLEQIADDSISKQKINAIKSAVDLANNNFKQKAMIRYERIPRDEPIIKYDDKLMYAGNANDVIARRTAKQQARREIEKVSFARDNTIRVTLVHAMRKLLHPDGVAHSTEDLLRVICQPYDVPPGLFLVNPNEHLKITGNWVDNVISILQDWESQLNVQLLKSESEPDWSIAWNTGIALTALQSLLNLLRNSIDSLDSKFLENLTFNFPRFSAGKSGQAACIPTSNPGIKVYLKISPWLAQLLQFDVAEDQEEYLWSLKFDTKRIGNKGNGNYEVKTGLTVAHLYYAVLIERLYQLKPAQLSPQRNYMITPSVSSDLPASLVDVLSPPERSVASFTIEAMRNKKSNRSFRLSTRRGSLPGEVPVVSKNVANSQRSVLPGPAHDDRNRGPLNKLISSDKLKYQHPSDKDELETFGSVFLDADDLDPCGKLQWMYMVLILIHKGQWFVVRPELLEDEHVLPEDQYTENRVHLALYDDLSEDLDWDSIVKAMPSAHWAIRIDGRGGFVCAVLDLSA